MTNNKTHSSLGSWRGKCFRLVAAVFVRWLGQSFILCHVSIRKMPRIILVVRFLIGIARKGVVSTYASIDIEALSRQRSHAVKPPLSLPLCAIKIIKHTHPMCLARNSWCSVPTWRVRIHICLAQCRTHRSYRTILRSFLLCLVFPNILNCVQWKLYASAVNWKGLSSVVLGTSGPPSNRK